MAVATVRVRAKVIVVARPVTATFPTAEGFTSWVAAATIVTRVACVLHTASFKQPTLLQEKNPLLASAK